MAKALTQEDFLKKAHVAHGDKYDYSESIYLNSTTKLTVICKEHGSFQIVPSSLWRGVGCAKCAGLAKSTTEQFILNSKAIHGDTYLYDKVDYGASNKIPVTIICRIHGEFEQKPNQHLNGQGCPKCGREKANKAKEISFDEFLTLSREKFDRRFEYDRVTYSKLTEPVTITCSKHGVFVMKAHLHLYSEYGCNKCAEETRKNRWKESIPFRFDLFEQLAISVHGNKYNYSKASYVNMSSDITIICPEHGEFRQKAAVHVHDRCGCPKCYPLVSKEEEDLTIFMRNELGVRVEKKKMLDGKEIDIYCPDYKIGIEYDGVYWHSDKFKSPLYHLKKLLQASSEGVRLIHIYDDEWRHFPEKCKSLLRVIFKKESEFYDARKCKVNRISSKEAAMFLSKYHLQNCGLMPSIAYGLLYKNDLIGVMAFTTAAIKSQFKEIELSRFATRGIVRGGFSKLLSAFKRDFSNKYDSIVSFSEKRWSLGSVYHLNGFEYEHTTDPSYWWVYGETRIHKRAFQKQYLERKLPNYDPNLSEVENCKNNGLYRIWDCGKDKWRLKL
jgi:hypothetical protein